MSIVSDVALEAGDPVALLRRTTHAVTFAPGPLPPLALRRIVEAGRLSPSLYNTQPMRFVVLRERASYERFRTACDRSRDTFVRARKLFALANKRLDHPDFVRGLARQKKGRVLPEHGYAIVVLQDDRLGESIEACACALMAMQLQATALGLASAFTSWSRGLNFQKDVVAFLSVPDGFKIFTSLVVGNPASGALAATAKTRRPFDDAVSWL